MLTPAAAARLRTQLTALPELCAYAWLDLIPASSTRYGTIHTGRTHAPSPVNEQVLSLLGPGDYLRDADADRDQTGQMPASAVLSGWCRVVTGRTNRNISTACTVLLEHWPATTESPYSWRLADDIGRLHGALEHAAHAYSARRTLNLPCPACSMLSLQGLDGCDIRCANCGAEMTQADYDRRADTYADALGA